MTNLSISLTDRYGQFVQAQIDQGRFYDAGEVLRPGLKLLEREYLEEQQKLDLLRKLAGEGFDQLDQGLGIEVEGREELHELLDKLGRGAA